MLGVLQTRVGLSYTVPSGVTSALSFYSGPVRIKWLHLEVLPDAPAP